MKILFKNVDNSIGIITPTDETLSFATVIQVAEKDVPHDLPYWIVEDSIIPTDRIFRSAWEIDESFGEPDGFGGESNEFSELQLRKKFMIDLAKYFVIGLRNTVPDIKDRVLKYIEKSKFFERDGLIDEFIQYAEDYDSQLEKELLNDNN